MGFVTRQVRVGYLQNSQTHPNARNDLLLTVVTLEIESHRKPSPRDLDTLCPQVCVSVKVLVCPWSLPVSFAPSCWPGSSVVTQMPHLMQTYGPLRRLLRQQSWVHKTVSCNKPLTLLFFPVLFLDCILTGNAFKPDARILETAESMQI